MIRSQNVHASAVALSGRGLLIVGPSGSGKSTLALALMALDAVLVADDRTDLRREGRRLIASAPLPLRGLIEARGVGILRAETISESPIDLVVDLGAVEDARMPLLRETVMLGLALPLVLGPLDHHLHYKLRQYLLGGRSS